MKDFSKFEIYSDKKISMDSQRRNYLMKSFMVLKTLLKFFGYMYTLPVYFIILQ